MNQNISENINIKASYKEKIFQLGKGLRNQTLIIKAVQQRVNKKINHKTFKIVYENGSNTLLEAYKKCKENGQNIMKIKVLQQNSDTSLINQLNISKEMCSVQKVAVSLAGNNQFFDSKVNQNKNKQIQQTLLIQFQEKKKPLQKQKQGKQKQKQKESYSKSQQKKEKDNIVKIIEKMPVYIKQEQNLEQDAQLNKDQIEGQIEGQIEDSRYYPSDNQNQNKYFSNIDASEIIDIEEINKLIGENDDHNIPSKPNSKQKQKVNQQKNFIKSPYKCTFCMSVNPVQYLCAVCQNTRYLPQNHVVIKYIEEIINQELKKQSQCIKDAHRKDNNLIRRQIDELLNLKNKLETQKQSLIKQNKSLKSSIIKLQNNLRQNQQNSNEVFKSNQTLQQKIKQLSSQLEESYKLKRNADSQNPQSSQKIEQPQKKQLEKPQNNQAKKFQCQIRKVQLKRPLIIGDTCAPQMILKNKGHQSWPSKIFILQKVSNKIKQIKSLKPSEEWVFKDEGQEVVRSGQNFQKKYQVFYQQKGQNIYIGNQLSLLLKAAKSQQKSEQLSQKKLKQVEQILKKSLDQIDEKQQMEQQMEQKQSNKIPTEQITKESKFIKKLNEIKRRIDMGYKRTKSIKKQLDIIGIDETNYQYADIQVLEDVIKNTEVQI